MKTSRIATSSWLRNRVAESRREQRKNLKLARSEGERQGKEKFCIATVFEHHQPSFLSHGLSAALRKDYEQKLEYQYYCDYPEISSLRDFCEILARFDKL